MNIFIQHRNNRAIALLIILIPILIYVFFFKDDVLKREKITGTVVEIKTNSSFNPPLHWSEVRIPDGTIVNVPLGEPIPAKGETIPLIVFTFKSGDVEYNLDSGNWP